MEQPNYEQQLYTNLTCARMMLQAVQDTLEEHGYGVFEGKKLDLEVGFILTLAAMDGLQGIFDRCIEQTQKPQSVCW